MKSEICENAKKLINEKLFLKCVSYNKLNKKRFFSLRNNRVRLSKSYDGNISDIVSNILTDNKSTNTKKELFIKLFNLVF